MAVPKPMQTEFDIHHRLESFGCDKKCLKFLLVISFWELNYGNNRFFTRKSEESISLVESVFIPARVDRVSHYGCRKSEKGGNEKDFFKNRMLSFHFIRVTTQTIDM